MEMTNATAAGPSYGIFDVIFGKKPQEEPAEGQEFGPLLGILKALEQANGEDAKEKGRTTKETKSGREGEEALYSVIPGMLPNATLATLNPAAAQAADAAVIADALANIGAAQPNAAGNTALGQSKLGLVEINPLAADNSAAEMSPEAKALLSGILLGGALKEASQAQAKMAMAADGMPNAKGLKALKEALGDKGEMQWTGADQPLASTQDFLGMRNLGQNTNPNLMENGDELGKGALAALAAKQAIKKDAKAPAGAEGGAGGIKAMAKDALENGASNGARSESGTPSLAGHSIAGLGLKAGAGTAAGVAGQEIFLDGSSKESVKTGLIPELAQSISNQNLKGGGEMRLIIRPDNLGELHVKVGSKGGKVEVSVVAENKEVADILRHGSKDLEAALGGHRLELAKFEVSVHESSTKHFVAETSDASGAQNNTSFSKDQSSSSWSMEQQRGSGGDFSSAKRESRGERRESVEVETQKSTIASKPMASHARNQYNKSGRLDVVA